MSHSCDEQYAIYDEREFRANKPHECDACDLPIRKGDRYTRVFMLHDGRKEHVKRCARCQLLHEHLRGLCEPGEQWPDECLNCGLSYESEWGPAPDWVNELAFWSPGDPLPATNPCSPEPNRWGLARGSEIACWHRDWRSGMSRTIARCTNRDLRWENWPSRTPSPCTEVCS